MIHKTAEVSSHAKLGSKITIWSFSQIREGAEIGDNCTIGRNVYIDHDVKISSNTKIQNNALIYYQSVIEKGVFIGPAACLINDKYPKSTNTKGKLKTTKDWQPGKIVISEGASIGAGAIILPDTVIGKFSLVGAGSVVTHSTPPYSKILGNPAKLVGYICKIGHSMKILKKSKKTTHLYCQKCKKSYKSKDG